MNKQDIEELCNVVKRLDAQCGRIKAIESSIEELPNKLRDIINLELAKFGLYTEHSSFTRDLLGAARILLNWKTLSLFVMPAIVAIVYWIKHWTGGWK